MDVNYWNGLANTFSDAVFEVTERDHGGVIRKTAKRLGGKNKKAIDFGCGAGASTRAIASFFGRVTGVDFSEKLLAVARKNTRANNIDYRRVDLTEMNPQSMRCDVAFCFNVLLSPDEKLRRAIAENVVKSIRRGGAGVFIVPSLESELRSYQVALDCQTRDGFARAKAAKELDNSAQRDVISLSQGIVNLGGAATKHFLQDELAELLAHFGLKDVSLSRGIMPQTPVA